MTERAQKHNKAFLMEKVYDKSRLSLTQNEPESLNDTSQVWIGHYKVGLFRRSEMPPYCGWR